MPAKSPAQQRYMGMCAHADHPPARCPSRAVSREFSRKPKRGYKVKKKKGRTSSQSL